MNLLAIILILIITIGGLGYVSNKSININFGTSNYVQDLNNIEIPLECQNKTYCHIKPRNYPDELIEKILDTFGNNSNFLRMPIMFDDMKQGNKNCLWGEDDCPKDVRVELIYMKRPSENRNYWQTVIQSDKHNFQQIIRTEHCKSVHSEQTHDRLQCFRAGIPLERSRSFCREIESTIELLALNDKMELEYVQYPYTVSCSCYHE